MKTKKSTNKAKKTESSLVRLSSSALKIIASDVVYTIREENKREAKRRTKLARLSALDIRDLEVLKKIEQRAKREHGINWSQWGKTFTQNYRRDILQSIADRGGDRFHEPSHQAALNAAILINETGVKSTDHMRQLLYKKFTS